MAEKSTIDIAEELLAKARTEADRAMTLADQARPAGPSRRFAEGPALPSAQKVTEGAQAVKDGAALLSQAAFALDLKLKLARSTNTFRSWQQIPAWCIGAGGLALAFFLAVTKFDSIGAWITVILILTLAVVAMFRGPADIALGTGGGGGASGGESGNHAEEPGKAPAAAAGDGASQLPSTSADPVPAVGPVAPADLATSPDGTGTSGAEPVSATAAPGSPTRPDTTGAVSTVAAAPTSPFPGPGGATGLKVMAMGLRYPGPSLLITPRVEDDFGARIEQALAANAAALRRATQRTRTAREFRGEHPHQPSINLADPTVAGWTYLLHADDQRRDDIVRILRPLAEHRRMPDPTAPLLYREEEDWQRWLEDSYTFLGDQRPRYILAVGGPAQIPFHLQSFLDVAGMVGRIDFEDLADLKAYVQKVLRLEQGAPAASPAAVFFAPDSGQDADGNRDPTYYSRRYMAAPLAERAKACGFGTRVIEGDEATRDHLVAALSTGRPALVYTASHGIAAIGEDLATQQRLNGAVCCQRTGHETGGEWLFTGDDVPADPDSPFLEGAVFFQFACYGYGTPAQSDFSHWDVGYPETTASQDFIASLPRRLLAHPRGPIAYIGHLDTAWLHGFDDPDDPDMPELLPGRWNQRLAPFGSVLEVLLGSGQPPGMAMEGLNLRYSMLNSQLTRYLDQLERGILVDSPELRAQLAQDFIARGDAQNYLIFGDPAVTLRISES